MCSGRVRVCINHFFTTDLLSRIARSHMHHLRAARGACLTGHAYTRRRATRGARASTAARGAAPATPGRCPTAPAGHPPAAARAVPLREGEGSRRPAMPSIQVPNSSSSQSPVRPREAKPRTGMVRGTHGKVPVQLAAQGQRTGPHEQRREGCRGAAGEGEMGAKVHVVDDGGTLAVKGWRDRGVAGESRTGTRLCRGALGVPGMACTVTYGSVSLPRS